MRRQGLLLELDPVPDECAPEAFARACVIVSRYYGVAAEVEFDCVDHEGIQAAVAESVDMVTKAIPAHPSHYAPRVASGQFTRRHPGNLNPRAASGRFRQRLSEPEQDQAAAEVAELVAEFTERLADHLGDYQERRLPAAEFVRRGRRDVARFYTAVYRRGRQAVGDPAVLLTPQDKAALNRLVGDEGDYLAAFAADMEAGRGTVPYAERMAMYGHAALEAAWLGWALGDQRQDRRVRWVYGNTEQHCGLAAGGQREGCSDFVARGWLPIGEFVRSVAARGFLPQSGQLECVGIHCGCRLEEQVAGGPVSTPPFAAANS